jgi:peptide/nickel transport system ATP-binding protein
MRNGYVLRIDNLCVAYRQNRREIPVLHNISFDLKEGESLSLLGESGSGKSTIAKAIMGLLPLSAHIMSGELRIGDDLRIDLTRSEIYRSEIRGTRIGMIFQDAKLALNPLLSIGKHFQEAMTVHKIADRDSALTDAAELLGMLGFSEPDRVLNAYPFQLSGGMCQRVCIALALCLRPSVLIADEPTSALDAVSQKDVVDLIIKVRQELGIAVLFITHDIAVANAVSDRAIILQQGSIIEAETMRNLLSAPKADYTRELLAARSGCGTPPHMDIDTEPLLHTTGLHKAYAKDRYVINDLNFALREREIIGILGQSGCGKSTLARCIVGLEKINAGDIVVRNSVISELRGKSRRDFCKGIQMIFQDARASLNPRYSALQLVQEPMKYLGIGNKNERRQTALRLLSQVGIDDNAKNRRPPQLSTGQCQRIAIARALTLNPEILICDEVVSALDMCIQTQILELLRSVHREYGLSIIMISHDIRVLRHFCHRIAVMHDGCFCEIGNTDAILKNGTSPHTRQLLECEYTI